MNIKLAFFMFALALLGASRISAAAFGWNVTIQPGCSTAGCTATYTVTGQGSNTGGCPSTAWISSALDGQTKTASNCYPAVAVTRQYSSASGFHHWTITGGSQIPKAGVGCVAVTLLHYAGQIHFHDTFFKNPATVQNGNEVLCLYRQYACLPGTVYQCSGISVPFDFPLSTCPPVAWQVYIDDTSLSGTTACTLLATLPWPYGGGACQ